MAAEAGVRTQVAGPRLPLSPAALLRALRGPRVRRLGWGVADQGVSSLTNFIVTLYVARSLGAAQFGAFSLAFVTYAFALNASRGVATDPLMVRVSGTDIGTWRRAVAACSGTATVIGIIIGAGVLAVTPLLSGTTRAAFLGLGITLPGLLLQDSWRFSFFALGRGSQAFLNDMIWGVALIAALLLLRSTGHADVFWYVLAWGLTATLAALVGPVQARVIPRLSRTREWVSQHRDLGPRYFVEGTSQSVAAQLRTYGVSLLIGLSGLGYVQAASTLMGPFLIILFGTSLITVPEAARMLQRSERHLRLFSIAVSAGLSVMALAWGVVLLVGLPRGLGSLLLKSVWRPTYPLVLPQIVFIVGGCASGGVISALHALGAARRSVRAMVIVSVLTLVFALAGAAVDGASGTVWAAAAAAWISTIIWWRELAAGLREYSIHGPAAASQARRKAGRHRGQVNRNSGQAHRGGMLGGRHAGSQVPRGQRDFGGRPASPHSHRRSRSAIR
jgi:O-antigen/teichoic acid export membrane protein